MPEPGSRSVSGNYMRSISNKKWNPGGKNEYTNTLLYSQTISGPHLENLGRYLDEKINTSETHPKLTRLILAVKKLSSDRGWTELFIWSQELALKDLVQSKVKEFLPATKYWNMQGHTPFGEEPATHQIKLFLTSMIWSWLEQEKNWKDREMQIKKQIICSNIE